jgi:membrane-associated phospholipid phosphatase
MLLSFNSKGSTHLEFNTFHNSFFDVFFYFITFLGDGVTALLVVILFLVVKFRYAIIIGVSNIVASLITQVLKHTIFDDVVRPKKFFEGIHTIYFVPGVDNYLYNSFPSGHSTCAFSLYFSFALLTKNKSLKFLFFTIAFLVGYSRIYLSQHFLEDVMAGSFIGVTITLLVFYFIEKSNKKWMDQSLISVFAQN